MKPFHRQHPIRGLVPRPATRPRPRRDLPRRHRRRGSRRPAGARCAGRADAPRLRDRGRAGVPRDPSRRTWLRADRSLRVRAHRSGRADRRDRRAGPAHRLDVHGRLARPPQRVRVHERPAARRQSRCVRAGRCSRTSTTRGRRFASFASTRPRRPPGRVGRRPASRACRRSGRVSLATGSSGRVDVRVRVSDPQSFIGWFVELPWLAAPHHPFRLAVRIVDRRDEQDWFVAARPSGRSRCSTSPPTVTSLRAPSRTSRPEAACSGTRRSAATACTGFVSFRGSGTPPVFRTGATTSGVRAWDARGNVANASAVVTIANGV